MSYLALSKRNILTALLPAFLVALFNVAGAQFVGRSGQLLLRHPGLYLGVFFWTILLAPVFLLLYNLLDSGRLEMEAARGRIGATRTISKKFFLATAAIIALFYFPVILFVFPGILAFDPPATAWQMIYSQPPAVAGSFLYSGIFILTHWIGVDVFGDPNIGMLLNSLVNLVLGVFSLAYVCAWIHKWRFPKWFFIGAIVFFALNPMVPIYLMTTTWDAPLGPVIAVVLTLMIDLIADTKAFFAGRYQVGLYGICVLLMILYRGHMQYAYLLALPFAVFFMRECWRKVIPLLLIPVAASMLFQNLLLPAAGFRTVDTSHGLVLPVQFQQVARVLVFEPDSLDPAEWELLSTVVPEYRFTDYNPASSDPITIRVNRDALSDNFWQLARLYFSLGMRHPAIYLHAALWASIGYFYLGVIDVGQWYGSPPPWNVPIIAHSQEAPVMQYWEIVPHNLLWNLAPGLSNLYQTYLDGSRTQHSLVNNMGLPANLLVIALGYLLRTRRYKMIVPLIVLMGYLVIFATGPVILRRYAFPLTMSIPAILATMLIPNAPPPGLEPEPRAPKTLVLPITPRRNKRNLHLARTESVLQNVLPDGFERSDIALQGGGHEASRE